MTREEFLEVVSVGIDIATRGIAATLTRVYISEYNFFSDRPILVCEFLIGTEAVGISVHLNEELVFDRYNVHIRDALIRDIQQHLFWHTNGRQPTQSPTRTDLPTDPWIPESLINRVKVKEEYEEDSFTKLSKKWSRNEYKELVT